MPGSVPQTALSGRSRSSHDLLAKGLGYFSLALGAAELLTPDVVGRAAGLDNRQRLVQGYGLREIATGVAILASHDATPWIIGRMAADAIDLATVLAIRPEPRGDNRSKLLAVGALLGVTALDALCAFGLYGEKGNRRTARADYSHRSGFPQGAKAAHGAARDFDPRREMRPLAGSCSAAVERARPPQSEPTSGERLATTGAPSHSD